AQVQVCADPWTPLVEEIDPRTRRPTGLYRRTLIPAGAEDVPATPVRCRLTPTGQPAGIESSVISTALTTAPIVVESTARVGMFGARTVRLAVVKSPSADLAFGLHEIRLGGPYLTRVPAGTVLRVTGQRGDHYRVRLTPTLDAWVPLQAVTWASPTARVPHLAFTSMVVEGEATADRVSIPYAQPVPFSVEPAQGPDGRAALHIDFYGAHCAATWITHRASARLIREVSVHQVATGHVRVRVDLEHRRLWGWRVEPGRGSLTVVVRAPPPVDPAPALPLRGLAIALEAGHGGTSQGARGLAQVDEKEVNRLVTEGLAKELIAVGARVVIIRNGDETVSLEERCQRTMKANANLFVSIHANASDTDRGFLRVGGASTYYKHSTSRDLAVAVQAALLRRTGLPDFGCVGNFNYLPVRALTWMPAVLVEQAFLSNPVEEAKLLDGEFRKRLIAAVREGIEEFVRTRGE
ncbi:MAG: N-acetylmuramoyl-L-alanine amidase, partial [Candidatus Riflebacteria bacterium]|nr:N-acetylmuramoyl-L-alanine amidase [Candidatus Riflebacteria bacterium]